MVGTMLLVIFQRKVKGSIEEDFIGQLSLQCEAVEDSTEKIKQRIETAAIINTLRVLTISTIQQVN
jgi:hypothetical protein